MAQTIVTTRRPAYQAYQILYIGFIAAPFLAGLDKFTHFLTNWDQYLAPAVERLLPVSGHTFMLFVGIVEMAAAVLVATRPRIGAYVVAAWLLGIIVNLLLIPGYFDVALRDFGLALGALALARLSEEFAGEARPSMRSGLSINRAASDCQLVGRMDAGRTRESLHEPTPRIESAWPIRVVGPYQPQLDQGRRAAAID